MSVGDTVGFLDRSQQQRSGRIIRLNDKTVTLLCNNQEEWRVYYGLLHRVVESSANGSELLKLGVVEGEAKIVIDDDE